MNPLADASISAVVPSLARRSTAAPLSRSCRTTSVLPLADAHMSGVRPRRSAVSTAAPLESSSRARARSPSFADSSRSASAGGAWAGVVAWLDSRPSKDDGEEHGASLRRQAGVIASDVNCVCNVVQVFA